MRNIVAEGDLVATYKTFTGTHGGEFMGIPGTGKRATFDAFDLLRLRDGKVVDHGVIPERVMAQSLAASLRAIVGRRRHQPLARGRHRAPDSPDHR